MKGSVAGLGLGVDLGAVLHELFGDVDAVFLRAEMHGREAVLGFGIDASAVFDEHGAHLLVSFLSGQM